jgi:hypothetical protein
MLIAGVCTLPIAIGSRLLGRRKNGNHDIRKRWQSNEFDFERAIEPYEELIDAHVWRRS